MSFLKYSEQRFFKALFCGYPFLCGNITLVSTTVSCKSLKALKSLSKLWPTSMVFSENIVNNVACTSNNVVVTSFISSSVIPENLRMIICDNRIKRTQIVGNKILYTYARLKGRSNQRRGNKRKSWRNKVKENGKTIGQQFFLFSFTLYYNRLLDFADWLTFHIPHWILHR